MYGFAWRMSPARTAGRRSSGAGFVATAACYGEHLPPCIVLRLGTAAAAQARARARAGAGADLLLQHLVPRAQQSALRGAPAAARTARPVPAHALRPPRASRRR